MGYTEAAIERIRNAEVAQGDMLDDDEEDAPTEENADEENLTGFDFS